ncbi:hypothetical protein [Longispora urticae]
MYPPRLRSDLRVASPKLERVELGAILVVIGVGLVASTVRMTLFPGRYSPWWVPLVALTLFPLGMSVLQHVRTRLGGRPPARLVVHGSGFVAPPLFHARAGRLLKPLALVAWYGVLFVRGFGHPTMAAWLAVLLLATMVALFGLLRPGPTVVLTPAGVEFRTWWRTRWTPWDEITAVWFRLSVDVRDRGSWSIPDNRLNVWPGYTADAIAYYRDSPGYRHLIGVSGELDRLHRELSEIWVLRNERVRRTGRWSRLLWPPTE